MGREKNELLSDEEVIKKVGKKILRGKKLAMQKVCIQLGFCESWKSDEFSCAVGKLFAMHLEKIKCRKVIEGGRERVNEMIIDFLDRFTDYEKIHIAIFLLGASRPMDLLSLERYVVGLE